MCVITKTEYIKQCLSPKWAPFELSVETCGGLDNELILRVYDWDADGGHVSFFKSLSAAGILDQQKLT